MNNSTKLLFIIIFVMLFKNLHVIAVPGDVYLQIGKTLSGDIEVRGNRVEVELNANISTETISYSFRKGEIQYIEIDSIRDYKARRAADDLGNLIELEKLWEDCKPYYSYLYLEDALMYVEILDMYQTRGESLKLIYKEKEMRDRLLVYMRDHTIRFDDGRVYEKIEREINRCFLKLDRFKMWGHLQLRNFKESEVIAREALRKDHVLYGESALPWYVMGFIEYDKGNYNGAIRWLTYPMLFSSGAQMTYLDECYLLRMKIHEKNNEKGKYNLLLEDYEMQYQPNPLNASLKEKADALDKLDDSLPTWGTAVEESMISKEKTHWMPKFDY